MIISHKHKFIFIKTRKTAGSSVEESLKKYLGPTDVFAAPTGLAKINPDSHDAHDKHISWKWVADNYPVEWRNYYKFTVDRNPWDKVVSFYFWYAFRKPHKVKRGFEHYVMSPHIRKCSDWSRYANNKQVQVDEVIPYEKLHETLSNHAVIPYNNELLSVRLKGTQRPPGHYSCYYNQETKARVAEFFTEEIRYFRYRFEDLN